VSDLCKHFEISRTGYYKGHSREVKQCMGEGLVVDLIVRERHIQPRTGGRKLYHMYENQIHAICPHLGRDKFFGLLREEDLLVPRKRSYTRTTNSVLS
jgi:hypothetical protein